MVAKDGSTTALYAFCGSTALALSYMGGAFAILPAYEADIFGTKYVGAIHGRMLLFVSGAALAGPTLISTLRGQSEAVAISKLMEHVQPAAFESAFGAPMSAAPELIASKTINISKLMAICPPGTSDPTPYLYDNCMQALGCVMVAGAVSNAMVRPLKRRTLAEVAEEERLKVAVKDIKSD